MNAKKKNKMVKIIQAIVECGELLQVETEEMADSWAVNSMKCLQPFYK